MNHSSGMSQIFERISEGIVAIDRNQEISMINRKAKEIFGIIYKYDIGHPSGKLEKGDIVIIGDNSIGLDDGGIKSDDLESLGIDENVPEKSAFVYIGEYGIGGEYKCTTNFAGEVLFVKKNLSGKELMVSIDFADKMIMIEIDGLRIPYSYVKGIGHIAALDGKTRGIKFYQSRGYTIRNEDLKSLVKGGTFMEKSPGKETELEVLGEKVFDILKISESIKNLIRCSEGRKVDYINKYDEINGRPVRCSIYPIEGINSLEGAFLKFEDLSDVKEIIEEKDRIVKKLLEIGDAVNDPFDIFIGESDEIKRIKELSKRAALSSLNILILGESGTGKSILANIIHNYSKRNHNRFVEINCGALSESILESELFGYVPGAFTGAKKEGKKGLIEYANGGTLFLDEISEMPLSTQVKLLHVLQNKRFIPVGGTQAIEVDVRFICATNRNLIRMVEDGKFREDLFYRINVMPITIPSLRERKEDLYCLCQAIIQRICKRDNLIYRALTNGAFNMLYSCNFPGNVRELENILERALYLSDGDFITEDCILTEDNTSIYEKPLKNILEDMEERTIRSCMKKYSNDKVKVMEVLQIKKTAFYEKLSKYNIN